MDEPTTLLLRRGEVEAWLLDKGLRARTIRKLFEEQTIKPVLVVGVRAHYSRDQIRKDILGKIETKG